MRPLLALALCSLSAVALAAPKPRPPKPAAPAPAPSAPPAAPAPEPAAAAKPAVDPSEPTSALFERVSALYQALEYDRVLPAAEALLARADITLEQKLEGYRLYASAKAIVEDPIEAEKPFRMLLRARPDYDLPRDTSPKILGIFRKVQSEERALASQLEEVQRARVVDGLKLLGEPPHEAKGGKPLRFSFRLKDPTGAVDSMRLPYRKAGEPQYSSLALTRGEEGDWRGTIPGEFTSNEKGFKLEYFVETLDAKGPLLRVGDEKQPKEIVVAPGAFSTARPPPLPKGVWFAGLGLTAALGAAAGGVGIAYNDTQTQYRTLVNGPDEVDGAQLQTLSARGKTLGEATTGLLISTGSAALITAVLTPFINWAGAEAP